MPQISPTTLTSISFDQLLRSGLNFAMYRNPGELGVGFVASANLNVLHRNQFCDVLNADGFVFAPYDGEKHPILFIPNDISEVDLLNNHLFGSSDVPTSDNGFNVVTPKEAYLSQVAQIIDQIKQGQLKKAILSRIVEQPFDRAQIPAVFDLLCQSYPNAYVFCVATKSSGLWIGATPELLLDKQGSKYVTVALAGTRKADDLQDNALGWHAKEVDEQAFVTTFIADVLLNHGIINFEQLGPEPIKAGQVVHLRTTFKFSASLNRDKLSSLVMALHPTPAVAGLPKHLAMTAISQVETHDRLYYGGFLGRIHNGDCHLFVSLRCMQVLHNLAYLFVGGGITQASDAQLEWDETVLKSQTLLSVLKNI